MTNNFTHGVKLFLQGFELITQPTIRRFVIIPLIINILVFIGLFLIAKHYIFIFNTWLIHFLPTWLQWLSSILWLLFLVSFVLLLVYAFALVANIISAPFNGFLSEQVEERVAGTQLPERTLYENIKDMPRLLGRQLGILAYYLPRALLLLLLFFIPVIQLLAPFLWLLFHAWFMALIYVDYPTDNHRVAMRDVRLKLHAHRALTLGFGASVLIASMIPIVNLFTIPAAVAGATLLWLQVSSPRS